MNQIVTADWLQPWMFAFLLTYCRIQACLITLPVFSERVLSARVKICLAMALTPLFAQGSFISADSLGQLTLLVAAETVAGLVLGGLVRLVSFALDIASTAIATTASLSQIIGVPNEYAPHPIGNLLHLAGLALLMTMGFPILVCDLLQDSFALKPLGSWPNADEILPAAVSLIGHSFILAMVLAAPFVLGGFLFQALSGVVSKVMPALPIVFIGAPAAILLALVGLAILVPAILAGWAEAVLSFTMPVP